MADAAAKTSAREPDLSASADTSAGIRPEDLPTVVGRAPAGLVTRIIQPAARASAGQNPATTAAVAEQTPATASAPPAEAQPAQPQPAQPQPIGAVAASPAAGAAADAIAEAPQLQWYVMPPGAANQYGPAAGEEFRNWIAEGRVTADSLVWRQDWPEWKRADAVFSQLQGPLALTTPIGAPAPVGPLPGSMPLPTAAVGAAVLGVGSPPVGQFAQPLGVAPAGMAAGGFPAIATAARFPVASEPAAPSARRPARPYRPRSNTGPMIVIIALVVVMIPLSYVVFKVVSEQLAPGAPAKPAAKAAAKAEESADSSEGEPAAGSIEEEE